MEFQSTRFDGIMFECYDKALFSKFGESIVKVASTVRIKCNQVVSYLESLGIDGGQDFTFNDTASCYAPAILCGAKHSSLVD